MLFPDFEAFFKDHAVYDQALSSLPDPRWHPITVFFSSKAVHPFENLLSPSAVSCDL